MTSAGKHWLLCFAVLAGCGGDMQEVYTKRSTNFHIIELDGCEYVVYSGFGITHKGNCRFCNRPKIPLPDETSAIEPRPFTPPQIPLPGEKAPMSTEAERNEELVFAARRLTELLRVKHAHQADSRQIINWATGLAQKLDSSGQTVTAHWCIKSALVDDECLASAARTLKIMAEALTPK